MQKKLIIPGIIITLLTIYFYISHENNLELHKAKDQKIESLQAEIEWKDRIIAEFNQQLSASADVSNKNNILTAGSGNSDRSLTPVDAAEEEKPDQIQGLKTQISDLSSRLEHQTGILRNLSLLAPFSKINLVDDELDDYFARITEISQRNLYASEYMMNPDKYGTVQFDTSDVIPETGKRAFNADQSRLYAHFDLADYPYQSVLIKWYREGVSEPLEMSYFDINPYSGENYAWIEPKSNWGEGRYYVEIYSASESAELLSAGSYKIE